MYRTTIHIKAIPGAYFNPLASRPESFSLVGMMFNEMQSRVISEDIVHFIEHLSLDEKRKKYYENHSTIHGWFEVAVALRNPDMVSQLVKFVHETPAPEEWESVYETIHARNNEEKTVQIRRHWGLTSYHYHCLLRVFSYQGDMSSIQQLVQIMKKKSMDEIEKNSALRDSQNDAPQISIDMRKNYCLTSTINANTMAWMMWMNWSSGGLGTALKIFRDIFLANEPTVLSRNLVLSPQDGTEDEFININTLMHSAPLSMLVYICSYESSPMSSLTADIERIEETKSRTENGVVLSAVTFSRVPPELVVVIAASKRLLGIDLTPSDYIHLLLSVLNNHRIFQRIQRNVLYNHKRSKELHDFSCHTSFEFLTELVHSVFPSHGFAEGNQNVSPHNVVNLVLTSLHGAFRLLGRDTKEILKVGFVQTRQITLNGWVRTVLDDIIDNCRHPETVFDALVAWSEVHRRPTFCVNVCNYLYQRLQTPPNNKTNMNTLASLRTRVLQANHKAIVPTFTTVSILGDVVRSFPAGRVASFMLPRLVFFTSLCLNADVYREDTRWYIKAQQLMFARTPKALLQMLNELLNTKYADESKISFPIIREGIRCCLDACVWLAPMNPRISEDARHERLRWWVFNDARDIALTLYGFAPNINEKVRDIYERNASPSSSKSNEKMHSEFQHILAIDNSCVPSALKNEYVRETANWTGISMATSPSHWEKKKEMNPYPHILLGNSSSKTIQGAPEDPFPEVFAIIQNINTQQPNWYVSDKDTVTRLLRCLLHRLEFKKAVELMRSAIKVMGYGQKVDRDIQRIFKEIGDPSGSIAFKLASGIMDGEVNQAKARHHSNSGDSVN